MHGTEIGLGKHSPDHYIRAIHLHVYVYDISELLWTINWPTGPFQLFVDAVKAFVKQALMAGNVLLVFDRYCDDRTKAYY